MITELRTAFQQRVDTMMRMAEQDVPEEIVMLDEPARRLRAKLILEEAIETCNALGFQVYVIDEQRYLEPRPEWINLEEIVDGCVDVMVVTTGCLSAFGIDDLNHMNAVMDKNCEKFINGVIKDEDGKFLKPEGWTPPDHGPLLATAGWRG